MLGSSGSEFLFEVGDCVEHVREPGSRGVVKAVDDHLSVMVRWDDTERDEFAWASKLRPAAPASEAEAA